MKQYLATVFLLLSFLLIIFLLIEHLQVPLLVDPESYMAKANLGVACLGVSLLIGDIFIPVPSSLIMVANGALFGVVLGTFLSVVGSLGAAIVGFSLGRRGGKFLDRFVPPKDLKSAHSLLTRWGLFAVILTRPLPLLAETTVIIAGTSPMPWGRLLLGVLVGTVPTAIAYAIAGALTTSFESTVVTFGLVLASAGIFWVVSRCLRRVQ